MLNGEEASAQIGRMWSELEALKLLESQDPFSQQCSPSFELIEKPTALLVDKVARIMFPLAFFIFIFAYCLGYLVLA